MPVHRCPHCSVPYVDAEIAEGACPACGAPLQPPASLPVARPIPPTPSRAPSGVSFLLGLIVGALVGAAALAAALLGAPWPGLDRTPASRTAPAEKAQPDSQAQDSEAGRQPADAARALDAANQKLAAAQKDKDDAEARLKDALARLTDEQGRRAALEKDLAEAKKPRPVMSFVRDWQLLGPFANPGGREGHDAVYPPEREPFQIGKTYTGLTGAVKWQEYHSGQDKLDLAEFYQTQDAGVAYAVSWVYADKARPVVLSIGSDDGVVVWVNRTRVDDVKALRAASPGQDAATAQLREGWNEVLAKVDNISGPWALYVEFRTADGDQALKVFSTSTPPPAMDK